MSLTIRVTHDDMTPDLRAKLAKAKNPQPVLRAMGTQVVSIAKRAFRDSSLRPHGWGARRDGTPATLIKKGMLVSSIRITELTAKSVSVGSDRRYAAIHQLGGIIRAKGKALRFFSGGKWWTVKQVKIPARPYLPFTPEGRLTALAERKVLLIAGRALARQLGS